MIKVYIVDDDRIAKFWIKEQLRDPGIKIIGESESGLTAVREINNLLPDVVLLDFLLPDISGLEVYQRVLNKQDKSKILFLTAIDHLPTLTRLAISGANGVMIKGSDFSFIEAIKNINEGSSYLQPDLAPKILNFLQEKFNIDNLSQKEYEVLLQYAKGISYEEIAQLLNVSPKTIANTRLKLFKKIDKNILKDVNELVKSHLGKSKYK